MNSTKQTNKFTRFLRNNAALLLIIFSVIAITTVVLVVTLADKPNVDDPTTVKPNPDPDGPSGGNKDPIKVYFNSPLQYTGIGMEFTDGKNIIFVENSTLNTWQAHKAVDLKAADGAQVSAMYDGTVLSVENNYGLGNIVKIDHGENVVVTYASLGDVSVVKGQVVKQGDKIGTVGTTASFEFEDGAHVHLEVTKDGAKVDPMPYVNGEEFREVPQK